MRREFIYGSSNIHPNNVATIFICFSCEIVLMSVVNSALNDFVNKNIQMFYLK